MFSSSSQQPSQKAPKKPSFSARFNILFPVYSLEKAYGQDDRVNASSSSSSRPFSPLPKLTRPTTAAPPPVNTSGNAPRPSTSRHLPGISESSSNTRLSISIPHASHPSPSSQLRPSDERAKTTPNTPAMPQLRSFASFSSLRSVNNDSQGPAKRKRLFPFHSPHISRPGSRSDVLDQFHSHTPLHASDTDSPPSTALPAQISPAAAKILGLPTPPMPTAHNLRDAPPIPSELPFSGKTRHGDLDGLQAAMAQLPATLSQSAVKRHGIQMDSPTATTVPKPSIPAVRSQPSSPGQLRMRSSSSPDRQPQQSRLLGSKGSASDLLTATVVLPTTSAPRPEHPLEVEARSRTAIPEASSYTPSDVGVRNRNITPRSTFNAQDHDSFFSMATSDSDDDEWYSAKYSSGYASGYSYASSQTSYGVLDRDIPDVPALDGPHDRYRAHSRKHDSSYTTASSTAPHNRQVSTSSNGSHRARRSNSFGNMSRPYSKGNEPPLPTEPVPSPKAKALVRTPSGRLGAIKEDANSLVGDVILDVPPVPSPVSHARNESRNFSRPRFRELYEGRPLPPHPSTYMKQVPASDLKSARPLSLAITKVSEAVISAQGAEKVILRIFEKLDSFGDVSVCARINKAFYWVYKKHELRLLKNALRNFSPAQWELREASPKEIIATREHAGSEYTPLRYVQFHKKDAYVVSSLKSLMLQRCQAHLRSETVEALSHRDPAMSARLDDAIYRIWTFCTIFGVSQARENDLAAQVDWLRGGVDSRRPKEPLSAAEKARRVKTSGQWMPSPSFGQGNFGGLSIDELDDMTEIWNALKMLLQGITRRGRVEQAKEYGLFNKHRMARGDSQAEQSVLDEWVHWIAIQGLSTINDLALYSELSSAVVFATARTMDWTDWPCPAPGTSRSAFLQLAITHAQEDLNATHNLSHLSSFEPTLDRRKSRGVILAAALRDSERGFDLTDHASLEDKGLGLWVQWMAQNEGTTPFAKSSPTPPGHSTSTNHAMSTVLPTTTYSPRSSTFPGPAPSAPPPRPPPQRPTGGSLSLFPTVAKQPNHGTGVSMTPLPAQPPAPRPRKGSILKTGQAAEQARRLALEQAMREDVKLHQQLYAPRSLPTSPPPSVPLHR